MKMHHSTPRDHVKTSKQICISTDLVNDQSISPEALAAIVYIKANPDCREFDICHRFRWGNANLLSIQAEIEKLNLLEEI